MNLRKILFPITIITIISLIILSLEYIISYNNKSKEIEYILSESQPLKNEIIKDSISLYTINSQIEIISFLKERYTDSLTIQSIDGDLIKLTLYANSIRNGMFYKMYRLDSMFSECDTILRYGSYETIIKFNSFIYK